MSVPARIIYPEGHCHICGTKLIHDFTACPICDNDSFYEEVRQCGTIGLLTWLDDAAINSHGDKDFYPEDGRLCLEYSLNEEWADQAVWVLDALRVKYSRRANTIELQLKPGWNGRFELAA